MKKNLKYLYFILNCISMPHIYAQTPLDHIMKPTYLEGRKITDFLYNQDSAIKDYIEGYLVLLQNARTKQLELLKEAFNVEGNKSIAILLQENKKYEKQLASIFGTTYLGNKIKNNNLSIVRNTLKMNQKIPNIQEIISEVSSLIDSAKVEAERNIVIGTLSDVANDIDKLKKITKRLKTPPEVIANQRSMLSTEKTINAIKTKNLQTLPKERQEEVAVYINKLKENNRKIRSAIDTSSSRNQNRLRTLIAEEKKYELLLDILVNPEKLHTLSPLEVLGID